MGMKGRTASEVRLAPSATMLELICLSVPGLDDGIPACVECGAAQDKEKDLDRQFSTRQVTGAAAAWGPTRTDAPGLGPLSQSVKWRLGKPVLRTGHPIRPELAPMAALMV